MTYIYNTNKHTIRGTCLRIPQYFVTVIETLTSSFIKHHWLDLYYAQLTCIFSDINRFAVHIVSVHHFTNNSIELFTIPQLIRMQPLLSKSRPSFLLGIMCFSYRVIARVHMIFCKQLCLLGFSGVLVMITKLWNNKYMMS